MFFLINKKDNFTFIWFREEKSIEITSLFTGLGEKIENETFVKEDLQQLPKEHKFIVLLENPFEKVLYDAMSSKAYNFEKYLHSIKKKKEQQITADFLDLNIEKEKLFLFNVHNIDMEELSKICCKEISNKMKQYDGKKRKDFQNPKAKLYRQPFEDIDFFSYHFQLHQFYNQSLQTIVKRVYRKDFEVLKSYDLEFELPVKVLENNGHELLSLPRLARPVSPLYKAKTEMQRINNKVGYCHLYEDHFMSIDDKGTPNISENHQYKSNLSKKNEFIDKNFYYHL